MGVGVRDVCQAGAASKQERVAAEQGKVRQEACIDTVDDLARKLEAVPSDVVCFISQRADEQGAHTAVMFARQYGAFPPNTLARAASPLSPAPTRTRSRVLLPAAADGSRVARVASRVFRSRVRVFCV